MDRPSRRSVMGGLAAGAALGAMVHGAGSATAVPLPTADPVWSPRARVSRSGPRVILRFDDGYLNNLEHAAPVMARHGFVGTLFTGTDPTRWLGTVHAGQPILTAEQLVRLHREYGWEIASHTTRHLDALAVGSVATYSEDVRQSIRDLVALGLPRPRCFAYPNGNRTPAMDRAMWRYVDRIGVTSASLGPTRSQVLHDQPSFITSWQAVGEGSSRADRDVMVANARRYVVEGLRRGECPVLGFHGVTPTPLNTFDLHVDVFTELMDWLAQIGAPVGLMGDLPPLNLLADAGFEEYPVFSGAYPWSAARWSRVKDSGDWGGGDWVMRLDTAGVTVPADGAVLEQRVPVRPGVHKLVVRCRQPVWSAGSLVAGATFHDQLGAQLGAAAVVTQLGSTLRPEWGERPVATFTVPERASTARITLGPHATDGYAGRAEVSWVGCYRAEAYDPFAV